MATEKHVPNWQLVYECVKSQGGRASVQEIAAYLEAMGRVASNARPDATLLSVNENSRVHYQGGRGLRRTDINHRHDLLFRETDGSFVLYDPSLHGVWEIYERPLAKRAVRLVHEPKSLSDIDEPSDAPPSESPVTQSSEPRLESHSRDCLEHNLDPIASTKPLNTGITGMTKLSAPAARVQQGDLTLYATSISVKDLLAEGFYSVETLDPENADDSGFQRLLNSARARKLADYVLKGQDSNDAFLPTSIFLATHKSLPFDEHTNTLTIDTQTVGAFSVVDGQHRLEGLRIAAEKDERVLKFQLAVNIAVGLPKIAQMCHFLIVNTTQKSVDKSVEQRLIARLTAAIDIEDVPTLPKWILRAVERGEVDKAVRYADYLNETEDSPWYGKIRMANADSDQGTINQKSFVKAMVKYVLTANNPLTAIRDFDKEKRVFLNYWKAVKELLDDGDAAVLYKYNGVELFCKFSIPFFMKLQDKGSFTVSTMTELLRACFENVEGDYAGVGHPEWWRSGSNASFLNAGAINQVSQELSRALHKISMRNQIEL